MASKETVFKPMLPGYDRDMKTAERLLPPEVLAQPGAKIADRFLDALGLPFGQWSSTDFEDPTGLSESEIKEKNWERLSKERVLAEQLTNHSGYSFNSGWSSLLSRDPRHFLRSRLSPDLLDTMDPNLAEIFRSEFKHHEAMKGKTGSLNEVNPFAYMRMPGGIDLVMIGYIHTGLWQNEHENFTSQVAKNAKVICIEGGTNVKYGDSLNLDWKSRPSRYGDLMSQFSSSGYGDLMRKAVREGFDGLFAETDVRDRTKINLDSDEAVFRTGFPKLPKGYFRNYLNYLQRYFPNDAERIGSEENLKEILKRLSTTDEGLKRYEKSNSIQNIHITSPTFVSEDLELSSQMTGLEYGEGYFSDAMAAIKLHLIAKEMREGRIKKGMIVDFRGAAHLETTFFFLKNLYLGTITALKHPQFLLADRIAKVNRIPSIYPAFSPTQKRFKDMFKELSRLEVSQPMKEWSGEVFVSPNGFQSPMEKVEIPGRREEFDKLLGNVSVNDLVVK